MTPKQTQNITFSRLPTIPPAQILEHMSDPRVGVHMPLLTTKWDLNRVAQFVDSKEQCWHRDGLGHWAFLCDNAYVGWGGFQNEADEWDFGLVLRPENFGLGMQITRKALEFAATDPRIDHVTFLLPPSRTKLGALKRMGAVFVKDVDYAGEQFRKYRLATK